MISPDELAAGMLPPPESEAPADQVHRIADAGIALAEQLQEVVPDGRHRRSAYAHLVRALQAAYAGIEPVMVPKGAEDEPIPYTVVADVDQAEPIDPALAVPDVSVWRLGVQTSDLHALARLLGLVLAEYSRPSGHIPSFAQPTLAQLAARAGLSLGTAHMYMGDLVTHGWVDRRRVPGRHGRPTHYQLRLPNPR